MGGVTWSCTGCVIDGCPPIYHIQREEKRNGQRLFRSLNLQLKKRVVCVNYIVRYFKEKLISTLISSSFIMRTKDLEIMSQ